MTSANRDPQPPQPKPPRVPRWQILNLTLRGIPELHLFPTIEERQKALHDIAHDETRIRRATFWMSVFASAAMLVVVGGGVTWALGYVAWPRIVERVLYFASLLVVGPVVFGILHRRDAEAQLRVKLLACGVPVCRKCGYLLRGLPLDPGRCPECGRMFDEDVRRILVA